MRRPGKAGAKAVKPQRPRTLKRRNAAKVGREAPAIGATERIALLEHRLNEALEQQTATSDVLRVISSSPGELKPVFEAILESATRICTAKFGSLFLYADNSFRIAAQKNAPLAYAERWRQRPVLAVGDNPHNALDRLASTKSVINIPDLMAERGYIERKDMTQLLSGNAGWLARRLACLARAPVGRMTRARPPNYRARRYECKSTPSACWRRLLGRPRASQRTPHWH
jgi:hypothetical protein